VSVYEVTVIRRGSLRIAHYVCMGRYRALALAGNDFPGELLTITELETM
jgi:hypothetical protein